MTVDLSQWGRGEREGPAMNGADVFAELPTTTRTEALASQRDTRPDP